MKTKTIKTLFIFLLLGSFLSGCGAGAPSDNSEPSELSEEIQVPEEFASLKNPYEGQSEAIAKGAMLFSSDCSSCHGSGGQGDGPAAAGLNPKPKNLAQNQASLGDGYLYWRISEGGLIEPFNSVMPAWKGLLEEDEIWQIVAFIRTLE